MVYITICFHLEFSLKARKLPSSERYRVGFANFLEWRLVLGYRRRWWPSKRAQNLNWFNPLMTPNIYFKLAIFYADDIIFEPNICILYICLQHIVSICVCSIQAKPQVYYRLFSSIHSIMTSRCVRTLLARHYCLTVRDSWTAYITTSN